MTRTVTGTGKSGWCMAPPGARVPHEHCRAAVCSCDCHVDQEVHRAA